MQSDKVPANQRAADRAANQRAAGAFKPQTGNERLTAEQMDEQRIQNVAYQYLCRLEEAKRWMEACLGEELPAPTELEEGLRNGVVLAKLGHRFAPEVVPLKKIYDPEQQRYQERHDDAGTMIGLSLISCCCVQIFHPETTDVYDKKNMPRAVYCIHALSLYLYRLGLAPQIHDLYGKVKFTEEEINNMKLELDKYGIQMPAFNKIGGILANELSLDEAAVHAAVIAINEAVDRGDVGVTAAALRNPNAMLTDLQEVLTSVYQEMLRQAKRRKAERAAGPEDTDMYEEYLTQREIQDNINIVNVRSAVEQVDEALDSADELLLLSALQLPCLALKGLRSDNRPWYLDQLLADRQQRALDEGCVDPLDSEQLQEGVTIANQEAQRARNMHVAVQSVNAALRGIDPRQTVSCLMTSDLQLPEVFPFAAALYHKELQLLQRQTPQGELQQEELFVAVEMLSAVALVNRALEAGNLQQFSSSLVSPSAGLSDVDHTLLDRYDPVHTCLFTPLVAVGLINEALIRGDSQQLLSALLLPSSGVEEVLPANTCRYLNLLSRARHFTLYILKNTYSYLITCVHSDMTSCDPCLCPGDNRSPWVRVRLSDGSFYFFHLNRLEGTWEKPDGFVHNSVFIDRQEIQEVVSSVSGSFSRGLLWRSSEALIVRLQAACRGFLIRQKLEARRRYLISQTPFMILSTNQKPECSVSMVMVCSNCVCPQVGAIIKIQAFFRANRARDQYRMLVHSDTPPLSVVRKFVHLLDLGDGDIREEAELLRLREEVVRSIRFNRQLEADLDLMDLKIGLLVRNRATLQEVVSHCKKLTKKNKEQLSDMMDVERSKGLKALSRERRERLEAYQHLFYLLQTQPLYLAQLIFLMPQSRSTSFMEMLVFSLFNYGSDRREAYLLLHLFTEALRYEIRLKVDQPQDVVTGNPTVIKMLVNFYRNAHGHNALREALGPALQDVLLDRSLSIRTDPVDVYKTWINQTETQTGHKSSLPYEVSAEDALSHPEVQRRIDIAIINLKNLTDRVLKAITTNLHKLPYGLRYTAKVLRDALRTKFPDASEDELYKIVGNLVYYRYMNPAVVAPDGFDVVDRSAGSTLQPEQRHILGSIARMLQHAAANKLFHGDGYHIRALNQYISQTHTRFRKFLVSVCDVPEPEDRFSMDEYSELLIVNRPVIYISVSELLNTHKLLLEHQEVLCPDSADPLRLLLKDLGSVPTLQELIGESSSDPGSESGLTQTCKMEVSLTLTNKFDIFNDSDDKPDARGLLLSTKQLIIDVIRTQPGDSLSDILRTSSSHDQEVCHNWLMQRRARQDTRTPEKMKRNQSLVANGNLSLEEKKRKILRSLRRLEGLGVLRPPQPENQILQLIAKDIRQQRLHRQRRGAEIQKLHQTLSSLQVKSSFHSEQVDYYRHYITSCLDNLTANRYSKSTNKKAAESRGKKKLPALSYSATRLQEKGVLLEIEDLPPTQFKNVVFDIVPGPERGSFRVKTRFLGVEMEEFLLKYQDLLQLQYEGVAVMKMFDKAKINVNLLIFLLNKKFFKK
uniref:IQ motif containing GTPase activating protein 3 n=1 Tax=Lates calcarifer TaxID=8187 RepID=A0A4W6DI86_LATCA